MKTRRLGVAAAVVMIIVFGVLPAVLGLPLGSSLSDPPDAQALPAWDYLTIERNVALSEIIVVGKVVRVDPARWNGPHGGKSELFSCASWDPMVYATFYVGPAEILKGTPKWGVPVAFRLTGAITQSGSTDAFMRTMTTTEDDSGVATQLAVGDTVVVFGEAAADRYGGGLYDPAGAYWLTMDDSSLWSDYGEGKGILHNHGLLKDPDEKELSLDSLVTKVRTYLGY